MEKSWRKNFQEIPKNEYIEDYAFAQMCQKQYEASLKDKAKWNIHILKHAYSSHRIGIEHRNRYFKTVECLDKGKAYPCNMTLELWEALDIVKKQAIRKFWHLLSDRETARYRVNSGYAKKTKMGV